MQKRLLLCLILAFVLLTSPAFVRADGTQLGTISGKVVDERGAALPGATVELTSEDKGFGRSMPTDLSGNFKFALLQSGPYSLKVSLAGFDTFVAKGNIVSPESGLLATLRRTLAQSAGAIMWSLRMIGVAVAFLTPWTIAIVLLVWIARRVIRARLKL